MHKIFLVGKPEGKRLLGRPRHRWKDNIRMDLRERGCDGVIWMVLAQDKGPVVGPCEHAYEFSASIKFG